MIAHRGLAAVADDGGGEQLRVSQQLFLRRIGRDIGHVLILIGAAGLVYQRIEAAHGGLDGAVFSGGHTLAGKVDVLVLDAALLEPALRFFGVEGFGLSEDLNIHRRLLVSEMEDMPWMRTSVN